jgi:predicted nucleic acid-binding protein
MIYILDSCALIAYIKGEAGEEIIRDLLERAKAGQAVIYMSVYNLLEVYYGFYRELKKARAKDILRCIRRLPITIIDIISLPVFDEAGRLKGSYSCSLADAVGIAVAVNLSGQFVTADHHEMDIIEQTEHLPFLWIR